jgi:hypothetical protein
MQRSCSEACLRVLCGRTLLAFCEKHHFLAFRVTAMYFGNPRDSVASYR